MKVISMFSVLFIFCVGLLSAQNVYKIPSGSQDNTISISIKNPGITPIEEVIISVGDKPEWVVFEKSSVTFSNIKKDVSVNAVFKFNIESDAQLDTESEILFNVESSSGRNWLKKIKFTITVRQKYELLQNYPNPFNPSTSIAFTIPEDSHVELKVFNILGEVVEVLLNNEELKAGSHKKIFNAGNLASGVYFYSIKAGDFSDAKKMLLMK